ncbi:MAG TPA: tRNA lysidine(34) synthetase TilS [Pirellulales bacterium]|jgi:tRNA(Ile)-lysidine synthase|nr:tRNA lysidine(34) synthetase TilS [Pirellulales bacterium]
MNEPSSHLGLIDKLAQAWPSQRWHDVRVIVAVSGGPDSVALIRGLFELRSAGSDRLVVAHFNHGLRDEAQADERFVVELARTLGLPCRVGRGRVGELAAEQGDGIEAAARLARYAFLHDAAHREGARYIATGHTADDQVETILHRIVRGTGLAGLGGMRRSRPLDEGLSLVRPLLAVSRRDVLDYLAAIGQEFQTDRSNDDPRFTRNRLRGQLLPLLAEQFNPQVHEALLRLGRLADESQEVIRALAEAAAAQCVVFASAERLEIEVRHAAGQPPAVLREMLVALWQRQAWPLQAMGLAEWDRLATAMLAPATAQRWTLPGGVSVEFQSARLRLSRAPV